LITTTAVECGRFSLRKQLPLFLENHFLVTDIIAFSTEAKDTRTSVDAAKI